MACAIEKLDLTNDEKELAKEYGKLVKMQERGMTLSAEEMQLIAELEYEATAGDRSLYIEKQIRRVSDNKLAELNKEKPKVNGKDVTIKEILVNDGDIKITVNYMNNNKDYYPNVEIIRLNKKDLKTEVLYSDPDVDLTGNYTEILAKESIRNVAQVKATLDTLMEIDDTAVSTEQKSMLKNLVDHLLNPVVTSVPEMATYLDDKAKLNGGAVVMEDGKHGIYLQKGNEKIEYGNKLSLAEIYMHELVHAATHFGINYAGGRATTIVNRLIALKDQAMQVITAEDFMPDVRINEELERALAEERFTYVNNDLEEFLAYALTNEKIFNKVKDIKVNFRKEETPKTYIDRLLALTRKLVDMALLLYRKEKKTDTGDMLLYKLSADLMKATNKANEHIDNSWLGKLDRLVEVSEDTWKGWIDSAKDKQFKKALEARPAGKSKVKYAMWLTRNLGILLFSKEAYPILKLVLRSTGLRQEGTVQTMIRHLKESDDFSNNLQNLTLMSGQIDRHRKDEALEISNIVMQSFKKKPSENDRKAMYMSMFVADGSILVNKFSNIADLYKDETKLDVTINKQQKILDGLVKSKKEKRFIDFQVEGLVDYILTGNGHNAQLRNAEAIAKLLGTDSVRTEVNPNLVEAIDVLVSLKAIKKLDPTIKERTVRLLEEETEGMNSLASMQKGTMEHINKVSEDVDRINRKKGYVRESYDDYISSTVAPIKDRAKLRAQGYRLKKVLPKSGLSTGELEMGLYTSQDMVRQKLNSSALRFTGDKQLGRTLFENALKGKSRIAASVAREERARAQTKTIKVLNDVLEGRTPKDLVNTVTPEFDQLGNIIEYRFNVSMEDKIGELGMDVDAIKTVGTTWSHQLDVEESEKLNDIVWSELILDMAKHFTGSNIGTNKEEYVKISSDNPDAKIADLAKILPIKFKKNLKEIQAALNTTEGELTESIMRDIVGPRYDELSNVEKKRFKKQIVKGDIWLRRDMLTDALGFRDVSIADAVLINKLPAAIKMILRKAENFWKEVIAVYKVDVVIKLFPVIIGNIISNLVYLVQQGFDPVKVAKVQLGGLEALNKYLQDSRTLISLKGQYRASKDEKLKAEIGRLEDNLKKSPVAKLMDVGMYQNIIEDVYADDFKSNSRITRWFDDKTKNMPEWVKVGGNWMYVTERTGLFQLIHRATAKSDFVARYSQFEFAKDRALKKYKRENGKDMPKNEVDIMEKLLLKEVRDNFVNYSRPDSAWWQWVNDMGFTMFTKYALRIQKVINDGLQRHPLRFSLALLGQDMIEGVTGWNPDDIVEKSVFVRGPFDLFYVPETTEVIRSIIVPQMYDNLKQIA